MKKKVIISACLLGENCRYDAQTKKQNAVLEAFADYDIIPFCPESPVFGTPRQRISVVQVDGKNRIITDETNEDVTKLLDDEINSFMDLNKDIDEIVLKSKSPSCGYKTTPILNQQKEVLELGNGIAAEMIKHKYSNVSIKDENSYI